jgi:hypothetical protein
MKVNSYYVIKAESLFTIAAGMLILTGCFFYIPSLKSELPGLFEMTFNSGVCFILSVIALCLPDALSGSQQQKKSAYVIILTTPGSKWPINEFAGRSSGGDRATKFISLTTCSAQPILKQ